jgi:hypothetical protein
MNRYARLAGFLYLTIIVTSILSLVFVDARIVVDGDPAATAERIAAHGLLFRAGLLYDTAMFAAVVALAWSLYVLLREVDRNLAVLGLLWRMAEAVVGAVTVLFGVLAVLVVGSDLPAETRDPLLDVLVTARSVGFDLTIFFLALGTIVFCRLLYTSRLVPRPLAGLGVASMALMFVGVVVGLLFPAQRDLVTVGWAPGIVFEAGIGLWLLVKGVPARVLA